MILLAIELEYVSAARCDELISKTHQIGKMIVGLQRSLRTNNQEPTTNNSP